MVLLFARTSPKHALLDAWRLIHDPGHEEVVRNTRSTGSSSVSAPGFYTPFGVRWFGT